MSQYQTLSSFMRSPFGNASMEKVTKYSSQYQSNRQKIKIAGWTSIEDSYYYHVSIPSETKKDSGLHYDVVIRFFTNDNGIKKEPNLQNYFIQFYSNSPGFIYHYAVIYKQKGFLIDLLYDKMDPRYKDTLPEKTNPNMELSFDKSIYFACRFLAERKYLALNKLGMMHKRKKAANKFFSDIQSFESSKVDQLISTFEKKVSKERKKITSEYIDDRKKKTTKNSSSDFVTPIIQAKKATKSTIKNHTKRSVYAKPKITAKKSTRKPGY